MGLILDLILLVIVIITVVSGAKKGFFKSLMSLISGFLALLIAITFTPMLSAHINEKYVLGPIGEGIETTFLSIAESEDGDAGYDENLLLQDSQFLKLMENAGYTKEQLEENFNSNLIDTTPTARIAALSYAVAEPIAKTISDIIAFVLLFIVSFILLKLITFIVGLFLKLPTLKELDKTLGVVFGIVSAVLFAFIFSMMADSISEALMAAAPGTFTENLVESSVIVKLLSGINPISAIAGFFIK